MNSGDTWYVMSGKIYSFRQAVKVPGAVKCAAASTGWRKRPKREEPLPDMAA